MKIRLREWEKRDAVPLTLLANNKRISDNLRDRFPYPYTLKDAEAWIHSNRKKGPVTNYAIEVEELLVGGCGILLKEDIYRYSGEIGYWLGEPFWGKGIATEAVRLLLEKIIIDFPIIVRVYAEVFAFNTASIKVLRKNGFFLETTRKNAIVKNNIVQDDQVWVKFVREVK
jgi:[ribosomal protein S5]-alanine N-acetyltransferase